MKRCVYTASNGGDVINRLLLLEMIVLTMTTAGCHGDRYDQPASRMMVLRDLPDGVEPNRAQHLIIRTGYKVSSLLSTVTFVVFRTLSGYKIYVAVRARIVVRGLLQIFRLCCERRPKRWSRGRIRPTARFCYTASKHDAETTIQSSGVCCYSRKRDICIALYNLCDIRL